MSSEKLALFEGQKYLCLETYKKNGQGVKTPVWFVMSNGIIYIATAASSGKVKRLNHNKSVKISPSNFKGEPKGEWMEGQAFFGDESELNLTKSLRNKKYGLLSKIIGKFVSRNGKIVSIGIKL
ncbi:PPOX class F420-dependent oxidoreductase [Candidatus Nitrosotalea bavarica]|uniref:PPOX class F420-dependent oxidoreductase n=1 Tax=Candidatus Nitrosotalea bavarica TaxID=1903277 RepID=UPI000C70CE68|nr:PPOX class F420-dependent oxidoreductase [Candidatus Nitrosotalea bavarica]